LTAEYEEDWIQLPPDGVGKKVRAIKRPDNRYEEVTIPLSLDGEVNLSSLYDTLNELKTTLDTLYELFFKAYTRKSFSFTFTVAGDKVIWTPATGKKIRLRYFQYSIDTDVEVGLRFGTVETKWAVLQPPCRLIASNLVGASIEGEVDQPLYFRSEGAVAVRGFVIGEEL